MAVSASISNGVVMGVWSGSGFSSGWCTGASGRYLLTADGEGAAHLRNNFLLRKVALAEPAMRTVLMELTNLNHCTSLIPSS